MDQAQEGGWGHTSSANPPRSDVPILSPLSLSPPHSAPSCTSFTHAPVLPALTGILIPCNGHGNAMAFLLVHTAFTPFYVTKVLYGTFVTVQRPGVPMEHMFCQYAYQLGPVSFTIRQYTTSFVDPSTTLTYSFLFILSEECNKILQDRRKHGQQKKWQPEVTKARVILH